MHILVLAHRLPYPPNKGEKIRTFHQIEYFMAQGYQVTVIAPSELPEDEKMAEALADKLNCRVVLVAQKWRKLKMLKGLVSGQSLSVANFYSHRAQRAFDQQVATGQVDWVLCTASSMAEYIFNSTTLAASQARLMMDFMDLDSDKWRQYSEHSKWPMRLLYRREQKLLTVYEKRIHQAFEYCFFVSQQEVDLFNSVLAGECRAQAVGNGIDLELFTLHNYANKPQPAQFLFTGVMDYQPNIDAVLWFAEYVWPQVQARFPGAEFVIAGMNPVKSVKALADDSSIIVTGFVDDIMPYYAAARIFVAPFRLARGVQNKVLQALACGIPVVATPMGAEGIHCSPEQGLCVAESASEFYAVIESLMTNPQAAEALAGQARQAIEAQYSWPSQLKRMNQIIREDYA